MKFYVFHNWYNKPSENKPIVEIPMLVFEDKTIAKKEVLKQLKHFLKQPLIRIILGYIFRKTEKEKPLIIHERVQNFFKFNKLTDFELKKRCLLLIDDCVDLNDVKHLEIIRFFLLNNYQFHLMPNEDDILHLINRNVSPEIYVILSVLLEEINTFALERFIWCSKTNRYEKIFQSLFDFTIHDKIFEVLYKTLLTNIVLKPIEIRTKLICTLKQLAYYNQDMIHRGRYKKIQEILNSSKCN
jgi:hypothetical protein